MNWKTSLVTLSLAGLAAFASGCAVDTDASSGEDDESNVSEAELRGYGAKIVGNYAIKDAWRAPTFTKLALADDGTFDADIDTGIRCFRAPCPSSAKFSGTFSATKSYLTLSPTTPTSPATQVHGRYKYTVAGETLHLSRSGAGWSGWGQSLEREASDDVFPTNATKVVAVSLGGGFVAPPPPGSTCTTGAQKYTFEVSTKSLAWEVCDLDSATSTLKTRTGFRVLTQAEVATTKASLREVNVSDRHICGADKPVRRLVVSTPAGDTTYNDDFYSCRGAGPFVENIDQVFATLRPLAK